MARTEQIVGLDLLRFGAAVMVMASHIAYFTFSSDYTYLGSSHGAFGTVLHSEPLVPLSQYGWVGVPVFFVISGFVIAYTANGASVFAYLKSRIVRLLPAAWICATITASLMLAAHLYAKTEIVPAYLKSLTLFPVGPWIDDVYWTLPIEIAFYTGILLLLAVNAMRRAEIVFTVVGLISAFAWLLDFSLDQLRPVYDFVGLGGLRLYLLGNLSSLLFSRSSELDLLTFGCYFATGLIIWVATRRGFTIGRILSLLVINAGGLAYIIESNEISTHRNFHSWPAMLIYLLSVGFVIFSVRFNRFFPQRYTREIGLATYPLYLVHNVVGSFLFGHFLLPLMPPLMACVLAMLACLALVFMVIRPLERRLQRLFRRAIDLGRDAVPQSVPALAFVSRATIRFD